MSNCRGWLEQHGPYYNTNSRSRIYSHKRKPKAWSCVFVITQFILFPFYSKNGKVHYKALHLRPGTTFKTCLTSGDIPHNFPPSHSNIKDLLEIANKKIKNVFGWCNMNKLFLNSDKIKNIFFIRKKIKAIYHFAFQI